MSKHPARIEWQEFKELAPAVNAAILALSKSAEEVGLEKPLLELVKLRVSQINRCAFCVQFHLNIGRDLGIPSEKLDLIIVWREAGIFSEREQAAFAWAELLTRISENEISDSDYAVALRQFSKTELAYLTAAIGAINVWNRVAVAFRFAPPIPARKAASAA